MRPDLLFDLKKDHVYVMTDRKLSKVRVQDCAQYADCNQCLGARDPYCGWCSLENKCSLRGDCRDAALDPLYWISYKSGRCTTITSVNPYELQRTTARSGVSINSSNEMISPFLLPVHIVNFLPRLPIFF